MIYLLGVFNGGAISEFKPYQYEAGDFTTIKEEMLETLITEHNMPLSLAHEFEEKMLVLITKARDDKDKIATSSMKNWDDDNSWIDFWIRYITE